MPKDSRPFAMRATARAVLALAAGGWAIAIGGWAPSAAAQTSPAKKSSPEPELAPVTVTATRVAAPVDEVPATVTVISDTEAERNQVADIKDLVRFEPGVSVRSSPSRFTVAGASTGRDGNSGFNIRGLEGNQVLMQVDGIRLPYAYSFGPNSFGRGDYLDLETVKTVEILRGPASTLYGSDGLAGAVSFATKDPADLLKISGGNLYTAAKLGAGTADRSRLASASLAGRSGDWEGLLIVSRRLARETETMGSNHSPNLNRTVANPQHQASTSALAKLVYRIDAAQALKLTVDALDRHVNTDALSGRVVTPTAPTSVIGLDGRDELSRRRYGAEYQWHGSGWLQSARLTGYYQETRADQFAFEDRNTSPDRIRASTYDQDTWGGSLQLESRIDAGSQVHRLVYGIDASRTRIESRRDGVVPPVGETLPSRAFPNTDYTLVGAFVQDEWLVGEALALTPALRFDSYRLTPHADTLYPAATAGSSDSALSPKLGVVWKIAPQLSAFAQYSRGFRAPTPEQVNNGFSNPVTGYRSIANPDLKPETSNSLELGVRGRSGLGSFSLVAFDGRYRNFIAQTLLRGNFTPSDPAIYQYVNLGRVRIWGSEARGELRLGGGWSANLGVAYARGQQEVPVNQPLDTVDPLKIVAGGRYQAADGRWGGQLMLTRVSGKAADRVSDRGWFRPGGFTVLDLTGFYRFNRYAELSFGVFNLTDRKYWHWSDVRGLADSSSIKDAYTQPGRHGSATVRVQFW